MGSSALWIFLAALAVPQGGAKNTALIWGFLIQLNTSSWFETEVRSSFVTSALGALGMLLSTDTTSSPSRFNDALTPAVPQKSSRTTTCSLEERSLGSAPPMRCWASHALVTLASSGCPSLKECALKQPALKHTCLPFGQAPPVGAFVHWLKLKSKQIGRFFPSLPTYPL